MIASLVQVVEMILRKHSPVLYESLGVFLPLITTNCAILGVVLLNVKTNPYTGANYTFIGATVNGFASGVGFLIAILLMAGVREKIDLADVPKPFEGLPAAFIAAGLMAIAFLGFAGMTF